MQRRPRPRYRLAALAFGLLACLGLAGCGARPGPAVSGTPTDERATTPVAAAESATPVSSVMQAATAAAPAPTFSASWLHDATPWAGWLTQATPSTGAFSSAAPANADPLVGWRLFVSQQGGFSIRLPGDPSPGVQTVPTAAGTLTLHTFVWQNDASGYYVGYADYPAGLVNNANLKRELDGARDGAVAMVHGTLLSEQDVTLAGMPARQVVIQAPYPGLSQGLVVTARFGMDGNRQYQVEALSAGPPTAADNARFVAFFQAFSLSQ